MPSQSPQSSVPGADVPVDVVITWVDGADPAHVTKRMQYAEGIASYCVPATDNTRFDSQGEIYVCICSILLHLPFVRFIWLVTDSQSPAHLEALQAVAGKGRIKLVDHRDILGTTPDALPTFNSVTIETAMWRIQGLAEHFIYFNDDMFVGRPLTRDAFFKDTRPVVRGIKRRQKTHGLQGWITRHLRKPRYSFRRAQEHGAQLAGKTRDFTHVEHWPHPLRVTTLSGVYGTSPTLYDTQVSHRFRHPTQHWPIALANHLEGGIPAAPPSVAYLKPGALEDDAIAALISDTYDFGCMQSLDEIAPGKTAKLFDGLADRFKPLLKREWLG